MTRARPTPILGLAALLLATTAHAQLAQSNFAAGSEGWLNVTLPYPSAVPPAVLGTYPPVWVSSLGGYIRLLDPDGSGQFGDCQYWVAPAAFLGNKSGAYGGTLEFDLACSGSGFGSFHQEDIILVGGGMTLIYDLASVPPGSFMHYTVPMSASAWKRGSLAGPAPTADEFRLALASLSEFYIRAEHQLGPDTQFLDNVTLSAGTLDAESGPRSRVLALDSPVPNPSRGAVQIRFVAPRAGAGAVEVFDAAGRQVVDLTPGPILAGSNALVWNGRDAGGRRVPAGLYWTRVRIGSESASRAIIRVE